MKIRKITITDHRIKVDPVFPAAWDSQPRDFFDATVVAVETDSGQVGYGSGDAMYGFEGYSHLFLGKDALDIDRHYQVLENISFHASRCWPLDLALWDLKAVHEGVPVYQALGGSQSKVPLYASTGSHKSPEETSLMCQEFEKQGFQAIKLRFGRSQIEADFEVLDAAMEATGGRVEYMVDCNQGWRMPWDTQKPWTLKKARTVAEALEERGVLWMEEPLHRGDYEGMAALCREREMWIAGAEMTRDAHEFDQLIREECLDVLQPDVVVSLGMTGLYRIGNLAKRKGIRFSPHTWGNGLGVLANAHVAAAVGTAPFLEYPLDPPAWVPSVRDFFFESSLLVSDGHLDLGTSPGWGQNLDTAVLKETETNRRVFQG